MKTFLATTLIFIFAVIGSDAAVVEYRVYRLSGDQILPDEIIRLIEENLLIPAISGLAPIAPDGAFIDDHTSAISYPAAFSAEGVPTELTTSEIGYIFSGTLTKGDDLHELKFVFSDRHYLENVIYLNKNGKAVALPITQSLNINSSAAMYINQWIILGGPADPSRKVDSGARPYLAIRVVEK